MHLVPTYFDLQLIKGNIFQYSKALVASIKSNCFGRTIFSQFNFRRQRF